MPHARIIFSAMQWAVIPFQNRRCHLHLWNPTERATRELVLKIEFTFEVYHFYDLVRME